MASIRSTFKKTINRREVVSVPVLDFSKKAENINYDRKTNEKLLKDLVKTRFNYEEFIKENLNLENLIVVLNKIKENERSMKEYHLIATMLEQTDFKKKFIKLEMDDKIKLNLLYFCSINLTYQFFQSGDIIFSEGDLGDCMYITIKGKIKVLRTIEKKMTINGEEYLNILINLRNKGFKERLHRTIYTNERIYQIDKTNIPFLEYVIFVVKMNIYINRTTNKEEINELFVKYKINPAEFDIDMDTFVEINFEKKDKILKVLNKIILKYIGKRKLNYDIYDYIQFENKLADVIIYDNIHLVSLGSGSIFGDAALDDPIGIRNASIQAEEDSHFGILYKDTYRNYIMLEKQKVINLEINFLIENFFFRSITPFFFKKKYFYDFIFHELPKHSKLIKEQEPCDSIYFVKEGEIELKIELTLLELSYLITDLISKTELSKEFKDYEDFSATKIKKCFEKINKKRVFKICILGTKEIIGLELFYFKIPTFYSATIISDKAKLYKIENINVDKILSSEKLCVDSLDYYSVKKFIIILKRLVDIRNGIINMYELSLEETNKVPMINRSPMLNFNTTNNKNLLIKTDYYKTISTNNIMTTSTTREMNSYKRSTITPTKQDKETRNIKPVKIILDTRINEIPLNFEAIKFKRFFAGFSHPSITRKTEEKLTKSYEVDKFIVSKLNFHEINKDFSLNIKISPIRNRREKKIKPIKNKTKLKFKIDPEIKEKKKNIIDIYSQNSIPRDVSYNLSRSSLNFKHLFVLKKKTKSVTLIDNQLII